MKILLVHQNFPGQFKHLLPVLLADSSKQVIAFTMNKCPYYAGLKVVRYQAAKGTSQDIHPWVAETETKVIRAEAAFRAALNLKKEGFTPDLILAHPGWGESLFLKQVWPSSKLIIYCEFHYAHSGTDVGFDPEFPQLDVGDSCRVRMKNVNNFLHFDIADAGISPTEWQKSTFPDPFRSKIEVIHDGINTSIVRPNPDVWLQVGSHRFTKNDEIITFVNRNLEPYRGYHIFMRSLVKILATKPNAKVIIVGGDGVSYGAKAPAGKSWKQIFLNEVKDQLDLSRVFFIGNIDYKYFIPLLQLSMVHVYLTYPFVLSWSLLEAMACGCSIVASNTAPLREAIIDNETGLLIDFFNSDQLANAVIKLLDHPDLRASLGQNARATAIAKYDVTTICLPKMVGLINSMI